MRQTELKIPHFTGPFAEYCLAFIKTKRAIGYKYESETRVLVNFDQLSTLYEDVGVELTRELVERL